MCGSGTAPSASGQRVETPSDMSDSETDTVGHSTPSPTDAPPTPGADACDCTAEVQAFAEELALAADDGGPEVAGIVPIIVLLAWWLYKKMKKKPPTPPQPPEPTPGG